MTNTQGNNALQKYDMMQRIKGLTKVQKGTANNVSYQAPEC